ncbi:MAG: LysR family transcriptional regulator [Deltaproteobacteria bacterium]|nr:LysR family transcriptional regulator [Deltaproteobacteria bacterium]
MNIDQLKTFYKVALSGSFTKAARSLHLTQPAVSQQIRALEHSLGITLFDRSGKKVRLTNEGDILLSHTDRLFNLYGEVQTLFELQQRLQKGKITIGSTIVLGTYFLPQIIGQYTRQYPGIEIDLRMGNSRHVLDITLEGEVDLGFAGKIGAHSRLRSILIHRDPFIIISSPGHYLAAKKSVTGVKKGLRPVKS